MTDPLLQCILARDDDEAADAWRRWRSSRDLDAIKWDHALMVPMVRENLLQRLLAGDDDAPRLTGLVRRAWTCGTARAAAAREIVANLASAGVGPVRIGGSLAAFIHRDGSGPIRPVTDILLLTPRHHIPGAIAALRDMKWELAGAAPSRTAYSWRTFTSMRCGQDTLRLAWRHVGTPPWRTQAAERALFANSAEVLPVESLLLSRLSTGGAWTDVIPWQADVALLASRQVDWDALWRDAAVLAPDALSKLRSLIGAASGVPSTVPVPAVRARIEHVLWRGTRAAVLSARRIAHRR